MKKTLLVATAAALLFASCGNNNTKKEQAQNEPVATETVVEEAPVEEAPAVTTWDHYDWELTIPDEGWKVDNAYSEIGLEKLEEYIYFNVKDWTKTTVEKVAKAQGCLEENRLEDIVTGENTWTVYSKTEDFDVAAITIDPATERVVRVGVSGLTDPKDPTFMTVLEGFNFKHFE
ncbi:MAG: hypothetical protein K6A28_00525 [Bacteroidales bacterium]|nr:hypothetical protein [Bacteroidales bacterium]